MRFRDSLPAVFSMMPGLAMRAAFASCAGDRPSGPQAQMVDIGAHRLEMRVEGTGTPVIVMDAGIAESIAGFGGLPLTVIAAGKSNPAFGAAAGDYQKYWIEQNRALAGKSAAGRIVLAEGSTHDLDIDAPELVENEILAMVEAVQKAIRGPDQDDRNK